MKILLIDTSVLLKKGTTVNVHEQNCRELIKYLNRNGHTTKFYHSNEPPFNEREQFDIILLSYGSFYFDFPKFVRLLDNQKNCRFGWMTNDYNLSPNSVFAKRFDFVIRNFIDTKKTWTKVDNCFANLNCLIVNKVSKEIKKKHNLIYYGTYRPEREIYFKRYFKKEMILSCSPKNVKKFLSAKCSPKFMGKMIWRQNAETLSLFKNSLYIEDTPTHKQYSHLANRFYESIMCNANVLFDKNCSNTIENSIFEVPEELIVTNYDDMLKKSYLDVDKNLLTTWQAQAIEEKKETLSKIHDFLLSLG